MWRGFFSFVDGRGFAVGETVFDFVLLGALSVLGAAFGVGETVDSCVVCLASSALLRAFFFVASFDGAGTDSGFTGLSLGFASEGGATASSSDFLPAITLRFFLGGSPDGFLGEGFVASPDALAFSACFRFLAAISLCFSRLLFSAAIFAFCV